VCALSSADGSATICRRICIVYDDDAFRRRTVVIEASSLGKDFSPGIEKVTMKLLEKLPDNRYQTASDVRDDLLVI